jgi:hypothetical protein
MMISTELVYRAILDLHARDANAGDWPDGVPESFLALGGQLRASGVDDGWILVVEQYVRRRATEFMAGKIEAEGWLEEQEVSHPAHPLDRFRSEVSNEEIVGSREGNSIMDVECRRPS